MGMTNTGTHTGIGTGEVSELAFAMALLGKVTGISPWRLVAMYDNDAMRLEIQGYNFFGDGKTNEAVDELRAFMLGNETDVVFDVVRSTATFVAGYDFPRFDTIKNLGASGKDDITLEFNGERVQGFSLKWAHDNAYRQQSVKWASINKLYGEFVDMSGAKDSWDSVVPTFTNPALRNSKRKGDYSLDLRRQTDKMMDDYDRIIWGEFIARMSEADPKRVATALLNLYTGGEDNITFVELSTGKATDVSMDSVDALADTIGRISFERNDSSGRTRRLVVKNNGEDLMRFVFTQSTNHAGSGLDRDYRIAKPQVYVEVVI